MALTPKLELRQSQGLVMTPQLQQAIKLLQMSNLELAAYVEAELERNPLLEREDGDAVADAAPEIEPRDESARDGADAADAFDTGADPIDSDFDDSFADRPAPAGGAAGAVGTPDSGWSSVRAGPGGFDGEGFDLEAMIASETSLWDHLTEQLNIAITDPAERLIGSHLIGLVNEAGYLTADTAQVAEQLGTSEAAVVAVLTRLQAFDPPGICARTVAECLALQLKERNRLDPAMGCLLDNLELLARHDLAALQRTCGVDQDDLRDMIAEIRELNPKPGNAFGAVTVQTVIPDVVVRQRADGGWAIELNNDTLPRVLVDNRYYAEVDAATTREEDRVYLAEALANANWLVRSLDQRARTILKVAREIVRQQDGFLAYGIEHLRPLNLRTVADAIGMHESTVSRVTANKYISTPRGIFELKYFFSSAVGGENGESHSAEAVRHRIKQLIDGESPANVLSDDRIVELLRDAGIEIARRTVAKYREALGIPSSVERRRKARACA